MPMMKNKFNQSWCNTLTSKPLFKVILLFLMVAVIICPGVSSAKIILNAGIDLFMDKDGRDDACSQGLYIGQYWVERKDNKTVFSWDSDYFNIYLRDDIEQDKWWLPKPLIISQFKDDSSTLCARLIETYCYDTIAGTEGLCTPEQINKLNITLTTKAFPALRFLIRGPQITIQPLQACCTPDGTYVKHVLWKSQTCPDGTESAGKTSSVSMCSEIPATRSQRNEQEEKRGCCLSEKVCDDMLPSQCGMTNGVPLPPGQLCTVDICSRLTGACKLESGCKDNYTRASCRGDLLGTYLGDGSTCPEPEPEKNACCVPGKPCSLQTEESCKTFENSKFLAGVTTCGPNICPKPKGGCCNRSGICT